MIFNQIRLSRAVNVLNQLTQLDELAMRWLMQYRVDCNEEMRRSGLIEIISNERDRYTIGVISLLNSLFGIDNEGRGAIKVRFDVICPGGHESKNINRMICKKCGEELESGKLIEFIDTGRR